MVTILVPDMGKTHRWTGAEVRALKEEYGLTLQQIANEVGAQTYVPVWRWVNEKAKPSPIFSRELERLKKRLEREKKEEE